MKSLETVYNDMFKGKTVKFKSFTGEETVILVESVYFYRNYEDVHLEVTGSVFDKYFREVRVTVGLNDTYEVI